MLELVRRDRENVAVGEQLRRLARVELGGEGVEGERVGDVDGDARGIRHLGLLVGEVVAVVLHGRGARVELVALVRLGPRVSRHPSVVGGDRVVDERDDVPPRLEADLASAGRRHRGGRDEPRCDDRRTGGEGKDGSDGSAQHGAPAGIAHWISFS